MCYPAHLTPTKTYDVWYSFTTDQDGGDASVILTHASYPTSDYGFFNMIVQGFDGSCGDFQTLGCFEEMSNISGFDDSTITLNLFNLLPLETYYFRAYNSTFTGNYAPIDFTLNAVGTALDPIVAVDEEIASLPLSGMISKVYPSPAGSFVYVDFEAVGQQSMSVCIGDILGNRVLKNTMTSREGMNHATFNIDALPPGMYIVYLENNGARSEASRFIKQ